MTEPAPQAQLQPHPQPKEDSALAITAATKPSPKPVSEPSPKPRSEYDRPADFSDAELLRYARQILLEGWDITAQARLRASRVLIVGAGGLGCPAAATLARAGVGHIYIVDDDVIEASNLQRQTLFTDADIGNYKADIAQQALQNINPYIRVDSSTERLHTDGEGANGKRLLQQAQLLQNRQAGHTTANAAPVAPTVRITPPACLLLDCSDNFATREALNRLSVQYGVPLLSASAIAMTGQLALYEPYKHTGCYHCVFGATFAESSSSAAQTCNNSGVLASTTTVMGNLQANVALQFLGLGHNPLQGKLLLWHGRSMTQNLVRYRQDRACPICAEQATLKQRL